MQSVDDLCRWKFIRINMPFIEMIKIRRRQGNVLNLLLRLRFTQESILNAADVLIQIYWRQLVTTFCHRGLVNVSNISSKFCMNLKIWGKCCITYKFTFLASSFEHYVSGLFFENLSRFLNFIRILLEFFHGYSAEYLFKISSRCFSAMLHPESFAGFSQNTSCISSRKFTWDFSQDLYTGFSFRVLLRCSRRMSPNFSRDSFWIIYCDSLCCSSKNFSKSQECSEIFSWNFIQRSYRSYSRGFTLLIPKILTRFLPQFPWPLL